jgi:NADPH:quinone reductase-like Zn-dependent oxidoreductase
MKSFQPPNVGETQYLVNVDYIGVNYADVIIREGYYTAAKGKYPLTPGFEYSGTVVDAGPKATEYKIGDKVCGITLFGGYSTCVVTDKYSIRKCPRNWTLQESAALLVPHLTAYHALNNVAHVKPGEVLLVHSGAGGVGTAILQQARHSECKTIAVVGNSHKVDTALRYGAASVIVKSEHLWEKIDQSVPDGFDVVLDANGLTTPREGFKRLKLGGRLVVYGFAEIFPRGKRPWLPSLVYNAMRVPRFSIWPLTSTNRMICGLNIAFLFDRRDLSQPALDYILNSAESGVLSPPELQEFSFNEAADAHRFLESGNSVGRVVLSTG